jgi:uncharacterized membrane protein
MTVAETEAPRRGRPRPEETIQRDQRALVVIREQGGSTTRNRLQEALGGDVKLSQAYLTLWRLRSQGLVERVREGTEHVWKLKG